MNSTRILTKKATGLSVNQQTDILWEDFMMRRNLEMICLFSSTWKRGMPINSPVDSSVGKRWTIPWRQIRSGFVRGFRGVKLRESHRWSSAHIYRYTKSNFARRKRSNFFSAGLFAVFLFALLVHRCMSADTSKISLHEFGITITWDNPDDTCFVQIALGRDERIGSRR